MVSVPNASSDRHPSRRRQNSFVIVGSRSLIWPSLDWLLVFVPVAIVIRFVPQLPSPTALFIVSCLAIIPLAAWMGRSTEHLAKHLGSGIGSLMNATFGNAAELIIALFALARGLDGVVKASITGSIIGNLLLASPSAIQKAVIVSPVHSFRTQDRRVVTCLRNSKAKKARPSSQDRFESICCDEGLALRNSLGFCLRIGYALLVRSAHQCVGFRKTACTCAAKLLPFCLYIFCQKYY